MQSLLLLLCGEAILDGLLGQFGLLVLFSSSIGIGFWMVLRKCAGGLLWGRFGTAHVAWQ
jgi:hypothetical protein